MLPEAGSDVFDGELPDHALTTDVVAFPQGTHDRVAVRQEGVGYLGLGGRPGRDRAPHDGTDERQVVGDGKRLAKCLTLRQITILASAACSRAGLVFGSCSRCRRSSLICCRTSTSLACTSLA